VNAFGVITVEDALNVIYFVVSEININKCVIAPVLSNI